MVLWSGIEKHLTSVRGTISAAQAAVQSFPALIACRFLLGFAEAPFFPGTTCAADALAILDTWNY